MGLRLAVYSDLHLEIAPWEPPRVEVDLVVLAGDIDNGTRGVEWARRTFDKPVLYVAGNHEYYEGDIGSLQRVLPRSAHEAGLQWFDCTERIIAGVRFLGCTLWTDYSLTAPQARAAAMEQSRKRNPDYSFIRNGERAFAPEDAVALCAQHRAWLEERLLEPFSGHTVVITHFAPHAGSIAPAFRNHPANPGFIVPLDGLMGRAVLWIHGHTHTAFDYAASGTRVLCNPRGYPDETTGFDPLRTVELPD